MPPPVAAAAAQSVAHLKNSAAERTVHALQVEKTRFAMREAGIPMMSSQSHIIPVPVGDARLCREASTLLLRNFSVYIQPINYPTVPRGTERLRITPTPFHNDELIKELVNALCDVWNTLGLWRGAVDHGAILHSEVTAPCNIFRDIDDARAGSQLGTCPPVDVSPPAR